MTSDRMEILDRIIQDLRGTCQVLDEVAAYWGAGELSIEDLQYIESEIFLCEGCGWWCELCEQHMTDDGPLCSDCAEGEEEDDE